MGATTDALSKEPGGKPGAKHAFSYFSPSAAPAAIEVLAPHATVMREPLFIGGDLHGNVAHNMLDCVFPAFISLLRLRAAAAAATSRHGQQLLSSLPDVSKSSDGRGGNMNYLLYDPPPCCPGWHRNSKERRYAVSTIVGRHVFFHG